MRGRDWPTREEKNEEMKGGRGDAERSGGDEEEPSSPGKQGAQSEW